MNAKIFLKKHSSTILTCLGAVGVIATAVTAVKETPKAIKLLEEAEQDKGEELTKIEKAKTVASVYIPSVIIGAATISCIFGSNYINKRTQAAMISAYALLGQSYNEYKRKVDEIYGEGANEKVIGELAKDNMKGRKVIIPDGEVDEDVVTMFEASTMTTFETPLSKIVTDDGMEIWAIELPDDFTRFSGYPW